MVLSGVGATLREERLRRQFSLEHVSNETRISVRYLEAIEGERMADLPGIVFTRGFVRQYARFLDVAPEELLSQLPKVDVENAALPAPPTKPKKPFWNSRWTRKATGFGACAAAAAAWVYFDLTPVVREASIAAIDAAARARNQQKSARTAGETQASQLAAPSATESTPAAAAVPPQPETELPAAVEALPPTSIATTAKAVQVLLRARADAWVSVIADGKPAFSGLLHSNDFREISGSQLVRVMTGNAGGLEISLNGKALEPLGPLGQVRTVRLTAEGLLPDGKAQSPEPDSLP
ncbi:MAG TPA: helix-turn-helix domain-containing protein [Bryobacteraceae bacterium]|nr:helix-turn-helix domain-containing protein [Bryobacteraceae bacterium]